MKRAVLLLCLSLCFVLGAAEKPVLRVGLMSDTHWKENAESFRHTEIALKTFKREKVDAVWHMGDIADLHYVWAYRYYRQKLFPSVFPENPPNAASGFHGF